MAEEVRNSTEQVAESSAGAVSRRIIRGMFVIIFFGLFLKLGGFLMKWLVNTYYGTGPVLDAFTAVFGTVIILLFFSSMLKVIVPAFMPLFAEKMHEEGEEAAWRLANTLLTLLLVAAVGLGALAFVFAPEIVRVLFPGFSDARAPAVVLVRWMVPGLVVFFFAIIALGILNSYKIFSFPSAAEAAQKLVWAAVLFLAVSALGVSRDPALAPHVIGAAFLAACVVQAVVLLAGLGKRLRLCRLGLPALSARRLVVEPLWLAGCALLFGVWLLLLRYLSRPSGEGGAGIGAGDRNFLIITGSVVIGCIYAASLWYRGRNRNGIMARFAFLAAPLIVGVLFARYRDLAYAFFQSYTPEGQFGVIELAKNVAGLPGVLVAYSLAIAMFPYLCDMAARRDTENLGRVVGGSLRMLAVFLIPLTAVTVVLSAPTMQLLFDSGKWTPEKTRVAGLALALLSTGIFFFAIENVLMQSFFSLQRTVLPTVLGIIFSVLPSVALYVIIVRMGCTELAFLLVCSFYPLARALKNICLLVAVHRRIPLISARQAAGFAAQIVALSIAAGAAAWVVHGLLARALPLARFAGRRIPFEAAKCVHVGVPGLAALIAFIAVCILLHVEEFQTIAQWVRERGWKKRAQSGQEAAGTPD